MAKWLTILGGAHAGKTDWVLEVCRPLEKVVWWGTAMDQPQDPLWQERLQTLRSQHKPSWTIFDGPSAWPVPEQTNNTHAVIQDTPVFVMDCLNLWLAAQIHRGMSLYSFNQLRVHLELEFAQLFSALSSLPCPVIVISAEVGWGVVPSGDAGRLFRDLLGHWNRSIVQHSDFGLNVQAGRGFLWPAGRTPVSPEGEVVRCVEPTFLGRLIRGI